MREQLIELIKNGQTGDECGFYEDSDIGILADAILKAVREKVEGMIKKGLGETGTTFWTLYSGYNNALADMLEELK